MKKIFSKIIIIFIIVIVIFAGFMMYKLGNVGREASKITFSSVNLQALLNNTDDGKYLGDCNISDVVKVKLEVVVSEHKIININLIEHINGKGEPAEVITDSIIEKQSLNIDTISGATVSSKAILKAVQNALVK